MTVTNERAGRRDQPRDCGPGNSAPIPAIIGRKVQLDDQLHEVVGVMPAAFDYPRGADVWTAIVPVLGDGVPTATSAIPTRCATSACCSWSAA